MSNIHIVSSSLIQAGSINQEMDRIELTPWDLQHLLGSYGQGGLLFRKPKPQEEEQKIGFIHRLKSSLSRTLDFFPPLAGRLAAVEYEDKTTSFFIDCNNAGALFVHALAEKLTISDMDKPVYAPEIFISLFPSCRAKNIQGISKPLLAVQVNELVDGIFIAYSVNHSIADGYSVWDFFNSWSEISNRGSDFLSKPPIFQRQLLDGVAYPIRIPRTLLHQQVQDDELVPFPPALQTRTFHLTKQNVLKLKTRANVEMNTNKISSFQAVLSHFWLFITRNKRVDPNEETTIFLVIGVRQRLQQLPERYFGNAIQAVMVTLKAGELVEKGHGNAAWEINKVVADQTEENLKKGLETWIDSPRIYKPGKKMKNALLVGSSPRFNVYGNDFGWGRPVAVETGPEGKFDGVLMAYPGVEEGSIKINICLSVETFQALENDEEFMDGLNNGSRKENKMRGEVVIK